MSWLKHLFKLREKSDNEVVKPFLDHMEDLRWTLIKMIVVLITGMTASFFYVGHLTAVMKAPLERIDPKAAANLIVTSPTDPFMVSLTLAFFGGIALTLPFLIYFLAGFIIPALTRTEKKYLLPGIAGGFLLFIAGTVLCYYFILPQTLKFFSDYAHRMGAVTTWTLKDYFSFVTHLTLAFGILCEVPIVMLVLALLGVIQYSFLANTRAYAVIIILLIVAFIAPTPDPITFISLSLPVILLYEICIWLIWLLERRRSRKATDEVLPPD